jgi:cytochrome c-type biogenesis protein CcmH
MVAKLAERLKQNPDDPKGWVMLARSYKAMGRYPEAAEAYGKGMSLVEKEPVLLADYAEMLAITGDGFRGKPTELIDKALKLAPDDPQILLLAGAAAGERRDFRAAVQYWEKVLPQLEPGSEEAEALGAALAQAREAANRTKSGKPLGK